MYVNIVCDALSLISPPTVACSTDNIATCWYYILTGSVLISSQLFLNGMR